MKALSVVAHPDDCIIFAWPLMDNFKKFDWTILYLTYNSISDRGREITEFWHRRKVATIMLGHEDTYLDMINNQISFDVAHASEQISAVAKSFDLIVTHDAWGDYGHIHHKFVHDVISQIDKPKIYFATQENSNVNYTRTAKFDLSEVPIHQEVIMGFHNLELGRYFIPESTKAWLNVSVKT